MTRCAAERARGMLAIPVPRPGEVLVVQAAGADAAAMKDRRELYLADHDHLRIRQLSVSVDSIPNGGGRAAAGRIPERKHAEITAEAAARLREDLQAMIKAVDGRAEQVRRIGLPPIPKRDTGPPYYLGRTLPTPPPGGASSSRPLPLAPPPVAPARRRSPRATPATRSTWPPRTGICSAIGARSRSASTANESTSCRPTPSRCSDRAFSMLGA